MFVRNYCESAFNLMDYTILPQPLVKSSIQSMIPSKHPVKYTQRRKIRKSMIAPIFEPSSALNISQNNNAGIPTIATPILIPSPSIKDKIDKRIKSQAIGGKSSNLILQITKTLKFLRTIFLKVKSQILCGMV